MNFKRTCLSTTVGAALCMGPFTTTLAAKVVSWELGDFNNDGLTSDFAFEPATPPPGNSSSAFGFFGETGCTNAGDGNTCDPIAFDAGAITTDVFTTGFNFGGTGIFRPNTTGNMSADITGNTLSFSALAYGGIFGGTQFFLSPDGGPNNVTVETLTALGGGEYGVVIRYTSTIPGPVADFVSESRLEGIMTTVPIPAATWLFGSGLLGLIRIARRKQIS